MHLPPPPEVSFLPDSAGGGGGGNSYFLVELVWVARPYQEMVSSGPGGRQWLQAPAGGTHVILGNKAGRIVRCLESLSPLPPLGARVTRCSQLPDESFGSLSHGSFL